MAADYQSQVRIQQLFRDLTPYRVARDLGLRLERDAAGFWTPHPQRPSVRIHVTDSEFVCLQPGLDFQSGDVFAFLAWRLGSHELAVRHVVRNYLHLATDAALLQQTQSFLAADLQRASDEAQLWRSQQIRFIHEPAKYAEVRMMLRRLQINPDKARAILFGGTGLEINRLPGLGDLMLEADEQYLVLPGFSFYSRLSVLVVISARNPELVWTTWLDTSAHAFFGVFSVQPGQPRVHTYTRWEDAAQAFTNVVNPDQGSVQVLVNPNGSSPAMILPAGIGMYELHDDPTELARSRRAFRSFYIASKEKHAVSLQPSVLVEWADFICHQADQWVRLNTVDSPDTASLLLNLRADADTVDLLLQHLQKTGAPMPVIQRVRDVTSRQGEFDLGAFKVIETRTGYVARKSNRQEARFTNFTLHVERNVWFNDSTLVHYGYVRLNQQDHPFHILQKDVGRPQEIMNTALLAVRRHNAASELPVVTDTTLKNRLPTILNLQASQCRPYNGVMTLGWNSTRTQFTTPTWFADVNGIHATSRILYPFADLLQRHYSPKLVAWREQAVPIRPDANTIVAVLLALLERSFLALPSPVVPVQDTHGMTRAVEAVMLALGQTSTVHIGDSRRNHGPRLDPTHLSGYPVVVAIENIEQLAVQDPVLAYSHAGLGLGETLTVSEYREVASMAYHAVSRLVVELLREGRPALISEPVTTTVDRLIQRGQELAEQHCQFPQFGVRSLSPVPSLTAALYRIPADDLGRHVTYDIHNQTAVIKLPKARRAADVMCAELRLLDPTARVIDGPGIEVHAGVLNGLLQSFYGQSPVVTAAPAAQVLVG